MNNKIKKIRGKQILDSRGNPTIEAIVTVGSEDFRASVPSGASTGINEAVELRDKDGGVSNAIENINKIISPELEGKSVAHQQEIDYLMIGLDGTKNKSKLGGNTLCAVSLAICRAGAAVSGLELYEYIKDIFGSNSISIPQPSFNIINGGCHADNDLDIQEFMVLPLQGNFSKKLNSVQEIYKNLEEIISKRFNKKIGLGDEGGFAIPVNQSKEALKLIVQSSKDKKIGIVLDAAASQFFQEGQYKIENNLLNKKELLQYYDKLRNEFPIIAIEDPYEESDWEGFRMITKTLGQDISIIGDDLLVTNPSKIRKAKSEEAVNAVLLKINQIGTVSEALEYARLARDFNWEIMVSHRSGETMDDFIADFSVGIGAEFIKSGAPSQKERMVKYNRLLEIEKKIQ